MFALLLLVVALGVGALAWVKHRLSVQEQRREDLQSQLRKSESWQSALEADIPATDPETKTESPVESK
jgi:uncharacterized protein HemX